MATIYITINNSNQCQMDGDIKAMRKLYQAFAIKHPNAYYIMTRGNTKWDGIVKYITDAGYFKIGLLQSVVNKAEELGIKYKITDKRRSIGIKPIIPTTMGNLTLRPDQTKALEILLHNKVGGVPFLICAANYAVNFGKSLLFCSIHKAFKSKLRTILLLNDSDLFEQFKIEMPKLLPDERITFVRGGNVRNWTNFTVAMVQSVSQNLDKYQDELIQIDTVLLDEADVIDNNTYKSVIERLYNSVIRIGLSGTLYANNLKKYIIHNMNVKTFIGEMIDEVKLSEQIKKGFSTPVVVKVIYCDYGDNKPRGYDEEYEEYVVNNKKSYDVIKQRLEYNMNYDRLPMLICTKYIKHCEMVSEFIKKQFPGFSVGMIHNEIKNRKAIIEKFREGKLDILVSTTIIFRGKNLPLLKYTLNISSMDSKEGTIQLLGRSVRLHESKTKAYIDDIVFPGKYNIRHGNHRKNYYISENMKVIVIPRRKKPKKRKRR